MTLTLPSGFVIDVSFTSNKSISIGLIGLVNAYKQGCHSRHEAAEYLGVTEEFFQDAIDRYRSKYGVCAEIDNYIVFFEPSLAVMEKSEIIGISL